MEFMIIPFILSRRSCAAVVSDVVLPFTASYWWVFGPRPFPAVAVCLRYGCILSAKGNQALGWLAQRICDFLPKWGERAACRVNRQGRGLPAGRELFEECYFPIFNGNIAAHGQVAQDAGNHFA